MSRERLEEHRRLWQAKSSLPAVYAPWFDVLYERLPPGARVLEIGAGPGLLAADARRRRSDLQWVATELLDTPWNDVVANGLMLPVRDACFDAVVGLDLLHHLSRPRRLLVEAARVLRDSGELIVLEPWVSPLSYPIYRYAHQEGCDCNIDPWEPFAEAKDAFEGDAAVLRRLLALADASSWSECGLQPPEWQRFNGFAWCLSLGFRPASLLPDPLIPLALALDRVTQPLSPVLGMRALAAWKRLPR